MRKRIVFVWAFLFCTPLWALDWKSELATSPSYLLLTGAKPDGALKPTGKFKSLGDDVIKRVKAEHPDYSPEAWMTSENGKQGVVVVCPATYDTRIDDVSCDTCPNSLFRLSGYETDQKWLDGILETWLRLDHGWDNSTAKSMLTECKITQVRKDTLCVEFSYAQVKKYLAKVNGLNQPPVGKR